jgi:two-component system NtrC family sensor kinase
LKVITFCAMPTSIRLSIIFTFISTSLALSTPQSQELADSLVHVIEHLRENDTTRMQLLAFVAYNQNDPQLKLEYAGKLMDLAREQEDLKYLHHAYLHQGQAYRMMGDFEIAIYALFKALDYAEKIQFENGIAGSNTALGDVYSLIGNSTNAVQYYKKSIDYMRMHDSTLLANCLLNLGDEYYRSKMHINALECFEESKLIYEKLGNNKAGLAYNLGNIGLVYAEIDQLDKAEENLQQSLKELKALDDHYGMAIFLSYLAEIYRAKGMLPEAKVLTDSSMSLATRFGLKAEIRDNTLRLADIYAMSADYETAYKFHRQYVAIKDSIVNDNIYSRIENLKGAFELAKKQNEVDLLTIEKKNQQIILTATVALTLVLTILALVIFSNYRTKANINKILEEQKKSLESLNHTKDKYFSIISHDLRGSVSSFFGISRMIKYLVASKDTKELLEVANDVEQSVERMSNLLDNLLTWAMQQQEKIPIDPEILAVNDIVEESIESLSNFAKGKKILLKTEIAEGLRMYADKNTTMTTIRNLASNALKFTEEGGSVEIKAKASDQFVKIQISDTGVGMTKEKLDRLFNLGDAKSTYGTSGEKGLGLGLQLVYEFVGLNQGTVKVESEEGKGTIFTILLPAGRKV